MLLAKIRGGANKMKVGEYALNRQMRPNDVLVQILSGKSIEHSLTISEGLSIFEIAEIFDRHIWRVFGIFRNVFIEANR